MLIHQLSSGMWGKYEAMKDDMKNNELVNEKNYQRLSGKCKNP